MKHRSLLSLSFAFVSLLATGLLLAAGCGNGEVDGGETPTVAITAPEADDYVSSRSVIVEGTAENTSEVTVSGERTNVEDGQWDVTVPFETDGEVTVTASAGDAEDSVDFIIDDTLPEIELTNPQRGAIIEAENTDDSVHQIDVEGQVGEVGPSGLLLLELNGQTVEPESDGSFSKELTVEPGVNRLTLHAMDRARNEMQTIQALIYGPLSDPGTEIDEALKFDVVEPEGTDVLADVLEAYFTPERVETFIAAALEEQGYPVDITEVDWTEMNVDLTATDGAVDVHLDITDLYVEGTFQYDQDSEPFEAFIEIGYLEVDLSLLLGAEDNQLTVDIEDEDIQTEDVTVNVGGEEPDWLKSAVEVAIAFAFGELISRVVEDSLYDPELLTREVEFLNRTITLTLLIQDVVVTNQGISIQMGFDFTHERHENVPEVAGALNRPVGPAGNFDVGQPFLFHSTRTAADRAAHEVWRSGLFHQRIGNDDLSDIQLPFDMTADGLANLLDPQIRDVHESDTPAAFQLRPLLPPVFEFGEADENHQGSVQIGDFLVDVVLIPENGKATVVTTIALHLDVDLTLEIEDNDVAFDVEIDADGDIAAMPEFELDRASTVEFITDLIEIVPSFLESDLSLDAATTFDWATIDNPTVQVHGQDNERVTVGVDVTPEEGAIEDDDVEAE